MGYFLQSIVATLAGFYLAGVTKLSAAITNSQLTLTIPVWPWMWPTEGNFTIKIDSEVITVTAGHGTTTLTITRGTPVSHLINSEISWLVFPSTRIFEGSKPFDMSTSEGKLFIQDITHKGPSFKINLPQLISHDHINRHSLYRVECILFFGVPQNVAQIFVDLISLLEAIKDFVIDQANWYAGAPSACSDVSWIEPQIDYLQNPAFGQVAVTLTTKR